MAKMMLTFRAADEADLADVEAIENASFSPPWSGAALLRRIDGGDTEFIAADESGWVVGFAFAGVSGDEAELLQIAVSEASRGRGVASELLSWTIMKLRHRGVRRLFLEVRRSNEAALALYGKLGFSRTGTRRGYYDAPAEDAVVMSLEVSPFAGGGSAPGEMQRGDRL
ncbi:MAG: ribosomal protein S18-alanine N-acetyltransferase [Oscillospiraceae bacterium]|jgi:ribosomal-protein-alanine N-acetyltransferase|nr:ribosomal protein S18-alanine N-acetyltransferase [Oscillospiraceae bacterium]